MSGGAFSFGSAIPRLLFSGCPSTITWLIISVIVDTIDAVLNRWGSAHIFKKCDVIGSPSVAHGDTARSINSIFWICLAVATALHLQPRSVFFATFVPFSMGSLRGTSIFFSPASATYGALMTNGTSVCDDFIPAIANAMPSNEPSTRGLFCFFDYPKPAKSLAG